MHNEFKNKIAELFPSLELVTLESFTKKIAIVSQVRIGENCSFKDYDEISLGKTNNKYGLIEFENSQKPSLPADEEAVKKHQLNVGDLLLSYRAKNHIKVLRVEEKPMRAIVGNTSTVRIEFKDFFSKEISVFVQSYLALDYVQEHLRALAIKNQVDNNMRRFLISPRLLRDLPIPKFEIHKDIDYQKIFKNRHFILETSKDLLEQTKDIYKKSDELLQLTLPLYEQDSNLLKKSTYKDSNVIDALSKLQEYTLHVQRMLAQYSEAESTD